MEKETDTYFPIEYYGEFHETEPIYEDSILSKYPLIDEKVMSDIPDFSSKRYEPFVSVGNWKENTKPCVGSTQIETGRDNPDIGLVEQKVENVSKCQTSVEDLVAPANVSEIEPKSTIMDVTPKEDEEKKGDVKHLKFQCRPRWGKDMDKELFKILREMEKTGEIDIDEMSTLDPKYEAPYHEGIQRVSEVLKWKGQLKCLAHRIRKLTNSHEFSVRDMKLFRKIIRRDYNDKPIDYDSLLYHFPGKSIEELKK